MLEPALAVFFFGFSAEPGLDAAEGLRGGVASRAISDTADPLVC
jgi:hypothetical protein